MTLNKICLSEFSLKKYDCFFIILNMKKKIVKIYFWISSNLNYNGAVIISYFLDLSCSHDRTWWALIELISVPSSWTIYYMILWIYYIKTRAWIKWVTYKVIIYITCLTNIYMILWINSDNFRALIIYLYESLIIHHLPNQHLWVNLQ